MAEAQEHARLSPSNHRWPNCPGSVREEAAYPDIAGEAAIDGTGSHLLLEMCLRNNVRAEAYDMQVIGANHPERPNGWLVQPDRIERVQMCLDHIATRVKALREQHPGAQVTVEAESRSNPGEAFGRDDWWGTCDITVTVLRGEQCLHVEVIDYKDGRGWVHAEGNSQLVAYAFGKLRPFIASGPDLCRPFYPHKVGSVRLAICQPKTNPVIRSWEPTVPELVERAEKLAQAAHRTDDPNAPLVPDDKGGKGWCQWCKHKPNCTAHAERDIRIIKTMSNDITASNGQSLFELVNKLIEDVEALPVEKLTELYDAKAGIMSIFDKAEAEIQRRLGAGEEVSGFEMKPGRGTNVWNESEEEIVKKLKAKRLKTDEIYPKKLASPAQILGMARLTKQQKDNIEKDLVTYKVGKPKLTRVAHKPKLTAEEMFAGISFLDPDPKTDDDVSFL